MKKISLYFQIHQPYRLRRYRFFDIGNDHYYNDDYMNENIFQRISHDCYYPATRMFKDLLIEYPDFHFNFVISGLAIEQMEYYTPSLIYDLKQIIATGRVDILVEPYAHSISSLYDESEFKAQVQMMYRRIEDLFSVKPKVFCNPELIYSDDIARMANDLGFEAVFTDSAKHVLGWKSPNYVYSSKENNNVKLLLRNSYISDMIVRDFSNYSSQNYPITVNKIFNIINSLPDEEQFINIYMNYEVLGVIHHKSSGIFDFFKALPRLAPEYNISFTTASDIIDEYKSVGELGVMYPISCSGDEKSVNEWTGNILQQGVINKLNEWGERIRSIDDNSLLKDWLYLQASDHLYYMNTINNGGGEYSPYTSPYDAFNNYMNVLSDLLLRAEERCPSTIDTEELNSYQQTIKNQNIEINKLRKDIEKMTKKQ